MILDSIIVRRLFLFCMLFEFLKLKLRFVSNMSMFYKNRYLCLLFLNLSCDCKSIYLSRWIFHPIFYYNLDMEFGAPLLLIPCWYCYFYYELNFLLSLKCYCFNSWLFRFLLMMFVFELLGKMMCLYNVLSFEKLLF